MRVQFVYQFLIAAFRFGTGFFQFAKQRPDGIQAPENQRDRLRRHFQDAVTELAEHVFTGMRNRFQARQAQEAAGTLDGVNEAENVAEDFAVARVLFELDHLRIQLFQTFRRLGQKFGK